MTVGIDEVGRGCWAGPLLVVAAKGGDLPGLRDSKLLSKLQRENLHQQLISLCTFGEGWVQPSEIDQIGLAGAMRLGVQRALDGLKATPNDRIIMDGPVNYCSTDYKDVRCVIKADSLHPIVSAASIYAKVTRDRLMAKLAEQYPHYGFEKHVGYGTKAHSDALKALGICDLHRTSFKPVYTLLNS